MQNRIPIIDVQTTGGTVSEHVIIECAYALVPCREPFTLKDIEVVSLLHRFADEPKVPPKIAKLTGITTADVTRGIGTAELSQKILALCDGPFWMTHYASFEKRFLLQLVQADGENKAFAAKQVICTHQLAQRLLPRLPSRSLRALAGFLGAPMPEFKRGTDHVRGSAFIWWHLREHLKQVLGADFTWQHVWEWQQTPITRPKVKEKVYTVAREVRLDLPRKPGVYFMKNSLGEVIYVGKATSLKERVNSYFRGHKGRDPKKLEMITQVVAVDTELCASPLEAALREEQLIKELHPRYNIAQRGLDGPPINISRELVITDSPMPWMQWPHEYWLKTGQMLRAMLHGTWDEAQWYVGAKEQAVAEARLLLSQRGLFDAVTLRELLARGLQLWRLKLKQETEDVLSESANGEGDASGEGDDEDSDDTDEALDVAVEQDFENLENGPDVLAVWEGQLVSWAREYWRWRWVNRLLNATLSYTPQGHKETRTLFFTGGAMGDVAGSMGESGGEKTLAQSRYALMLASVLFAEMRREGAAKWTKTAILSTQGVEFASHLFQVLRQR